VERAKLSAKLRLRSIVYQQVAQESHHAPPTLAREAHYCVFEGVSVSERTISYRLCSAHTIKSGRKV